MALAMWKGFEDQGFNIKENKDFVTDELGTRRSENGLKPLFEIVPLIDPKKNQITPEARAAIDEHKCPS